MCVFSDVWWGVQQTPVRFSLSMVTFVEQCLLSTNRMLSHTLYAKETEMNQKLCIPLGISQSSGGDGHRANYKQYGKCCGTVICNWQ